VISDELVSTLEVLSPPCGGGTRALEQLKTNSFFIFAERARSAGVEAEDNRERSREELRSLGKTSKSEYEVDASALEAEEGRGDRRNVQGELHAS
jgi:hypothetical protein